MREPTARREWASTAGSGWLTVFGEYYIDRVPIVDGEFWLSSTRHPVGTCAPNQGTRPERSEAGRRAALR